MELEEARSRYAECAKRVVQAESSHRDLQLNFDTHHSEMARMEARLKAIRDELKGHNKEHFQLGSAVEIV